MEIWRNTEMEKRSMSYFRFTGVNCVHYPTEWSAVVTQIQRWPSAPEYYDYKHPLPRQISHHLEAKALYVFTMVRRLVRAAYKLGGRTHRTEKANWKLIFVEATSLLFPMIELVGHARLGTGGSNASLCVGVHWLHNPQRFHQPRVTQADRTLVPALLNLEVGHLVSLRNYYLHGSKGSVPEQLRKMAKGPSGRPTEHPKQSRNRLRMRLSSTLQETRVLSA
jgi:hypothetical protein